MRRTLCEQNKEGRIANVSSKAHRFAYKGIYFDHLNNKSRYNPVYAYAQSKLANILHAKELTKHFKVSVQFVVGNEPMTFGLANDYDGMHELQYDFQSCRRL
ncbi:hypothetical protein R6Q59_003648 [Mikania micrantha]